MNDRLSLCIICRDDVANLSRLVARARPWAGEIVVVDTGSVDGSPLGAAAAGADVIHLAPELIGDDGILRSFSEARSLSFSLSTRPWQMWLDSDDDMSDWRLLPRIIELCDIERDRGKVGFHVRLFYDYSWNDDRTECSQSFSRERIVHRDDGWTWHRPLHEYLGRTGNEPGITIDVPRVIHMSQGARNMANDRNLRVLQQWERAGGEAEDPVALNYYMGDEFLVRGQFEEAFERFERARKAKPITTTVYWSARSAFRAARTLMCMTQYPRAAAYMADMIQLMPTVADLRWELSRALLIMGRQEEARKVFALSKGTAPIPGEDPALGVMMGKALAT